MDWNIFLKSIAQLAIGVCVVTFLAIVIFVTVKTFRGEE